MKCVWALGAVALFGAMACTVGRQESIPRPSFDGSLDDWADGGAKQVDSGSNVVIPDDGEVCDTGSGWLYLVDSAFRLVRYEPDSNRLTEIGTLNCPGADLATPFSMAVDRNSNAYVLYQNEHIYKVSTTDASCAETHYVPGQQGMHLFGMAFVTNEVGGSDETLYVLGGDAGFELSGRSHFAKIDTTSWTVSLIADVSDKADLAGNANAELWGFFVGDTNLEVRQFDSTDGHTLRTFDVSEIDPFTSVTGWAFGYWGGRLYLFYAGLFDNSTNIYRLTPSTGQLELVKSDIGYLVVGAGVSTCAPTELY